MDTRGDEFELNILHFSDVHLNQSLVRSDYRFDSSVGLFQSALVYANTSVNPQPSIVLYTGDFGPHINHFSPSELLDTISVILRMLRETFPSNRTRIISSIVGNSDCGRDDTHSIRDVG